MKFDANKSFELAAWIEAKIQAHRANKYAPDLAQELACSRTHLRAIQTAQIVPSNKSRLANLSGELERAEYRLFDALDAEAYDAPTVGSDAKQ